MQYTTLGRTGMTVSRICLGCMSYGDQSWRDWILSEDASLPFFRRAIEAEIKFEAEACRIGEKGGNRKLLPNDITAREN